MGDAAISNQYDVIIVGAGSMGMSAGYEMARRGLQIVMIDAFDPPHARGSHHGQTRLIRHVYHGGAAYVSLALRADKRWRELEEAAGEKLLERSGVLNMADPAVYAYDGRLADASEQGVAYEAVDAAEIGRRWPVITLPDSFKGLYEPNAGYLYSERCIAAYRRAALAAGARLQTHTTVTDIVSGTGSNGGVAVRTGTEVYRAAKALICVGAWFKLLEPFVKLPIRSARKTVGWFETTGRAFEPGAFPGFNLTTRQGDFYGFPDIEGKGLKIGRHDGGVAWQPGEEPAPFGHYPEDEGDLRGALEAFMPEAAGRLLQGAVCKYELTPDEHFIIDYHPEFRNVLLAGGFSGHGFKFASAVGEIAADLLEHGETNYDLRLFSLDRFRSKK